MKRWMSKIIYIWRRNWRYTYMYKSSKEIVRFRKKLSEYDIIWWIYLVNHIINENWINISRNNEFLWMYDNEEEIKEWLLLDKIEWTKRLKKKIELKELEYVRKLYQKALTQNDKNLILAEVINFITSTK